MRNLDQANNLIDECIEERLIFEVEMLTELYDQAEDVAIEANRKARDAFDKLTLAHSALALHHSRMEHTRKNQQTVARLLAELEVDCN